MSVLLGLVKQGKLFSKGEMATAEKAPFRTVATTRAEYRAAIRAKPMLERPYRFGHVYGNTVRRMESRQRGR